MSSNRVLCRTRVVVFLCLTVCAPNLPAEETGILFGPEVFARQKGPPAVESRVIDPTGFEPPFTMYLLNGDENGYNRSSSGEVWLDSQLLLARSDFSQQVEGHAVAVSLSESSVLEVWLAGKPQCYLTVWFEGQPIQGSGDLEVILDESNAVAQTVFPEDGGMLVTTGSDGTLFALEIPPFALLEAEEVTMTPIEAIPNLPLNNGRVRGVDLSPDGLVLIEPAFLTIRPPVALPPEAVVGFAYRGEGTDFHLRSLIYDGLSQSMDISHFSGSGVALAALEEVIELASSAPPILEDQFDEAIGAASFKLRLIDLGKLDESALPGIEAEIAEAIEGWFQGDVLPSLGLAIECGSTRCGGLRDLVWTALSKYYRLRRIRDLGLLPDDHPVWDLLATWENLAEEEFRAISSDYDTLCRQSDDFCDEQKTLVDDILFIDRVFADLTDFSDWIPLAHEEVCDGYLTRVVFGLDIQPVYLNLEPGESWPISVYVRNAIDRRVSDRQVLETVFIQSGEPSKVSVSAPEVRADFVSATVVGIDEIEATTVRAQVEQCSNVLTADLIVKVQEIEPASIQILGLTEPIEACDSHQLTAVVYDIIGNPIPDYPVEWGRYTPPGGCPGSIYLEPETGFITGMTYGTAGVVATPAGYHSIQDTTVIEVEQPLVELNLFSWRVSDDSVWPEYLYHLSPGEPLEVVVRGRDKCGEEINNFWPGFTMWSIPSGLLTNLSQEVNCYVSELKGTVVSSGTGFGKVYAAGDGVELGWPGPVLIEVGMYDIRGGGFFFSESDPSVEYSFSPSGYSSLNDDNEYQGPMRVWAYDHSTHTQEWNGSGSYTVSGYIVEFDITWEEGSGDDAVRYEFHLTGAMLDRETMEGIFSDAKLGNIGTFTARVTPNSWWGPIWWER